MNTENNYTEVDLGNVAPNPRGEYSDTETYEYLDYVSYMGGSYLCISDSITGVSPESGKNTEYWQLNSLPGELTPEYIAMHDRVVNLFEQVGADAEEVRESKESIESMEVDITNLHGQTIQAAEEAESSKDTAAGYASSAEQSRLAAETAEQNVHAQVTGFDTHVAEKITEAEQNIENARIIADKAILAQQENSVQEIAKVGNAAIAETGRAEQAAKESASNAAISEQNAKASEDEAKKAEENVGKLAEQVSIDAKQVAEDKAVVEFAREEMSGNIAQVQQNKEDIGVLKNELAVNTLSDAALKRKVDALWKLNQGISYQFETDEAKAYQKDVLSGAKLASVKKIGGRTIVWNQLIDIDNPYEANNQYVTKNDDSSYTISYPEGSIFASYALSWIRLPIISGHKYYVNFNQTQFDDEDTHRCKFFWSSSCVKIGSSASNNGVIITAPSTLENTSLRFGKSSDANPKPITIKPCLYDLTKMFGAGNEPATVEEFEAMFPEDYYLYDKGTLMSIPVNEVRNRGYSNIDISEFARAYPDKCNFSDGVLHILSADNDLYSQGIPATAKTGDKLTVDIKCGTATNARLRARLKTGVEIDITSGANATEWNRCECVLSVDMVALMLNWSTTGTFSVRNLCVNGKPYYCEEYPIPQAILDLGGYGDGVSDDVYNYVDWEEKKYHKRVGRGDLGKMTADYDEKLNRYKVTIPNKCIPTDMNDRTKGILCAIFTPNDSPVTKSKIDNTITGYQNTLDIYINCFSYTSTKDFVQEMQGVMLYYELAEEEIIDISDIIDSTFQEPIEVEPGGTLTFQNSNGDGYRLPVPSEEEYIVSLAEVNGNE